MGLYVPKFLRKHFALQEQHRKADDPYLKMVHGFLFSCVAYMGGIPLAVGLRSLDGTQIWSITHEGVHPLFGPYEVTEPVLFHWTPITIIFALVIFIGLPGLYYALAEEACRKQQ